MKLPFNFHLNIATDWVLFSFSKLDWFGIRIGRNSGLSFWIHTGGNRWLSYNLDADHDETIAWQFAGFVYTVPETEAQRLEREDAELEELWIEQESNRYVQWYY